MSGSREFLNDTEMSFLDEENLSSMSFENNDPHQINYLYLQLAKNDFEGGHYKEALNNATQALPEGFEPKNIINSNEAEALFYIAASELKLGSKNFNKCIHYFALVINFCKLHESEFSISKMNILSIYYYGIILAKIPQKKEVALFHLNKIAETFHQYSAADLNISESEYFIYKLNNYHALIQCYLVTGQYKLALEYTIAAKKMSDESKFKFTFPWVNFYANAGITYFLNKDYYNASICFEMVVSHSSSASQKLVANKQQLPKEIKEVTDKSVFYLGLSKFELGLFDQAANILERITSISPFSLYLNENENENYIKLHSIRAKALYEIGKYEEARKPIQTVLEKINSADIQLQVEINSFVFQLNRKLEGQVESPRILFENIGRAIKDEDQKEKLHLTSLLEANTYITLGDYHFKQNELDTAIEYFILALELFEKQADKKIQYVRMLDRLGKCFYTQKNYVNVHFYLDRLMKVLKTLDPKEIQESGVSVILTNLHFGIACNYLGKFNEGRDSLFDCNQLITNDPQWGKEQRNHLEAIVLQNLGLSDCRTKDFKNAESYLTQALKFFDTTTNDVEIISTCTGLALCTYMNGNLALSNEYANRALLTINLASRQNVDFSPYIPALIVWLDGYTYDKGFGTISNLIRLIPEDKKQDFKSLTQIAVKSSNLRQESFIKGSIGDDKYELLKDLKKNNWNWDEHELDFFKKLEPEVVQVYKEYLRTFPSKAPDNILMLAEILKVLQLHNSRTKDTKAELTFPKLLKLPYKDIKKLLGKKTSKSNFLIENSDESWIELLSTVEITKTDTHTLEKLNALSVDDRELLISLWKQLNDTRISAEVFDLAAFLVNLINQDPNAPKDRIELLKLEPLVTAIKIDKLRSKIQAKKQQEDNTLYDQAKDQSTNYTNFLKNPISIILNSDNVPAGRVITLWEKQCDLLGMDKQSIPAYHLLVILQAYYLKNNDASIPAFLNRDGFNIITESMKGSMREVLTRCPNAHWLKNLNVEEIREWKKAKTFLQMIYQLDDDEIEKAIAIWKNEKSEPFKLDADDFTELKRKIFTSVADISATHSKLAERAGKKNTTEAKRERTTDNSIQQSFTLFGNNPNVSNGDISQQSKKRRVV